MRFWNNISPRNNIEIANKYIKKFFKKPLLSEARKANERWLNRWRIHLQCGRPDLDPWVGKIPWRRAWQPTPVFLPGKCPWTEKPGGLQAMGSQRVRHDWAIKHPQHRATKQHSTDRKTAGRVTSTLLCRQPSSCKVQLSVSFQKRKQGCHGGVHVQKFRLGNPGTRVSRSLDCTTELGPTAKVSWSESPGTEVVSSGRDGHRHTSGWFWGEALHGLLVTSAEPFSHVRSQVWRGV